MRRSGNGLRSIFLRREGRRGNLCKLRLKKKVPTIDDDMIKNIYLNIKKMEPFFFEKIPKNCFRFKKKFNDLKKKISNDCKEVGREGSGWRGRRRRR